MPLFGKKKEKKAPSDEAKVAPPDQSYPAAAPGEAPASAPPVDTGYAAQPPPYSEVPPGPAAYQQPPGGAPYPQAGAPYPQAGAPYPQGGAPYPQAGVPYMAGGPPPGSSYMPGPQQQPYYPYPGQWQAGPAPRQNVIVQGGFDAGARFDGVSQPNIPPPPPGCAPNAAQMAAGQGHNVTLTQKPGNFWTGGSDGGAVFW